MHACAFFRRCCFVLTSERDMKMLPSLFLYIYIFLGDSLAWHVINPVIFTVDNPWATWRNSHVYTSPFPSGTRNRKIRKQPPFTYQTENMHVQLASRRICGAVCVYIGSPLYKMVFGSWLSIWMDHYKNNIQGCKSEYKIDTLRLLLGKRLR